MYILECKLKYPLDCVHRISAKDFVEASAWATTAKTQSKKLGRVQKRTILGALKSTPNASMERSDGVEAIERRIQASYPRIGCPCMADSRTEERTD